MPDISKKRLVELAEEKLEDARLLREAGRFSNAYYLAGYSVEILLKAIVSKRFSAETLPDRKLVNAVHTHNLKDLLGHAGLDGALASTQRADTRLRGYWQIVAAWTEESRYSSWGERDAAELLTAVDDPNHGIFQWLRHYL
jgi:HEPN domain-containing protein